MANINYGGMSLSKASSEYGNVNNAGGNALSGFKQWECYMILKYGKTNTFGVTNRNPSMEYLIELPIYPEQVSESLEANWDSQNVLGRSSSLAAYSSTSLKNVSFSLDLHRDLLTGSFSHTQSTLEGSGGDVYHQAAGAQKQSDLGPFQTRRWYVKINKMLQMSCYPQYTSSGLIPPTTYFIFGQMILKGFVKSYSTEWKKPIINTFYAWNTVNINMDCYPDSIITAEDLLAGQGAASTQNTYNTTFPTQSATANDVMRDWGNTNSRTGNSLGGGVRET